MDYYNYNKTKRTIFSLKEIRSLLSHYYRRNEQRYVSDDFGQMTMSNILQLIVNKQDYYFEKNIYGSLDKIEKPVCDLTFILDSYDAVYIHIKGNRYQTAEDGVRYKRYHQSLLIRSCSEDLLDKIGEIFTFSKMKESHLITDFLNSEIQSSLFEFKFEDCDPYSRRPSHLCFEPFSDKISNFINENIDVELCTKEDLHNSGDFVWVYNDPFKKKIYHKLRDNLALYTRKLMDLLIGELSNGSIIEIEEAHSDEILNYQVLEESAPL